mmetsp:Transcript_29272/g.53675  ORF Transcript_29272/g.53675 Transcript_29272/m.53675 type:complete len:258 (+) Transcript_29272:454-1227(+)
MYPHANLQRLPEGRGIITALPPWYSHVGGLDDHVLRHGQCTRGRVLHAAVFVVIVVVLHEVGAADVGVANGLQLQYAMHIAKLVKPTKNILQHVHHAPRTNIHGYARESHNVREYDAHVARVLGVQRMTRRCKVSHPSRRRGEYDHLGIVFYFLVGSIDVFDELDLLFYSFDAGRCGFGGVAYFGVGPSRGLGHVPRVGTRYFGGVGRAARWVRFCIAVAVAGVGTAGTNAGGGAALPRFEFVGVGVPVAFDLVEYW